MAGRPVSISSDVAGIVSEAGRRVPVQKVTAEARRRFDEERHLPRKTSDDVEVKEQSVQADGLSTAVSAVLPAMFPTSVRLATGPASQEGSPPLRAAGFRAVPRVALATQTEAPPLASLPTEHHACALRVASGPWQGLELHLAIHAGALTAVLRPASREQHERLGRAGRQMSLVLDGGQGDELPDQRHLTALRFEIDSDATGTME